MSTMQVYFLIFSLLLPIVLTAKEVPGEELPSNDVPFLKDEDHASEVESAVDGQNGVVKRSISEIAARRRSALDKSFMRFGRADPSLTEPRVKLAGGNLMRFGRSKSNGFLRLGRGRSEDFMRFGRSTNNNMMRFGRAANLMRFGRGGNNMMRFGRGGNNMMRFGRGGNNMMRFGRAGNNMMRFGRGGNNMMRFGRGGNNMMRFGRANLMRFGRSDEDILNYENEPDFDLDDEDIENETEMPPTEGYVRVERSLDTNKKPKSSNYADQQNDNFMRLGRSLLQKNYDDVDDNEDDNLEQYIGKSLERDGDNVSKNKAYIDDRLLGLGYEKGNTEDIQDPLEIIFPEESRKKRSLLKVEPSIAPEANPDISSVRHSKADNTNNCSL